MEKKKKSRSFHVYTSTARRSRRPFHAIAVYRKILPPPSPKDDSCPTGLYRDYCCDSRNN